MLNVRKNSKIIAMATEKITYQIRIDTNAKKAGKETEAALKDIDSKIQTTSVKMQTGFKQSATGFSSLGQSAMQAGQSFRSFAAAAAPVVLGITATVAALRSFAEASREQEEATAKVAGVLRATNNVLGISTKELERSATAMARLTGISDEVIMTGQATLATFKSIGSEMFNRTIPLLGDMSILFGSMKEGAIQAGKALEDPIRGAASLRRVGLTLTTSVEDHIRVLQESGDIMGAQTIIVEALEGQVGKLSETMGNTGVGSVNKFKNAWVDFKQEIGVGIEETARPVRDFLTRILDWTTDMRSAARAFGDIMETDVFGMFGKVREEFLKPIIDVQGVNNQIAAIRDALVSVEIAQTTIMTKDTREKLEQQQRVLENLLVIREAEKAEADKILEAETRRVKKLEEMNKLIKDAQGANRTQLETLKLQEKEIDDILKANRELLKTTTDKEVIATAKEVVAEYEKWGRIIDQKINKELEKIKPELTEQQKLVEELVKLYEKTPLGQQEILTTKIAAAQELLATGAGKYEKQVRGGVEALQEQLNIIQESTEAIKIQRESWTDVGTEIDRLFSQTAQARVDALEEQILRIAESIDVDLDFPMDIIDVENLLKKIKAFPFKIEFDPEAGEILTEIDPAVITVLESLLDQLDDLTAEVAKQNEIAPIQKFRFEEMYTSFNTFRDDIDNAGKGVRKKFDEIKEKLVVFGGNLSDVSDVLYEQLFALETGLLRRRGQPYREAEKRAGVGIAGEEVQRIIWKDFGRIIIKNWGDRIVKGGVLLDRGFDRIGEVLSSARERLRERVGIDAQFFGAGMGSFGNAAIQAAQRLWEFVRQTEAAQEIFRRFRESMRENLSPVIERLAVPLENLALAFESFGRSITGRVTESGDGLVNVINRVALGLVKFGAVADWAIRRITFGGGPGIRETVATAVAEFEDLATMEKPFTVPDGTGAFGVGGGGVSVRQPQVINVSNNFYGAILSEMDLAQYIIDTLQVYQRNGGTTTVSVPGVTL